MDLKGNTDIVWPHQGVEEVTLNNERDGEREFNNTNMTPQEILRVPFCVQLLFSVEELLFHKVTET